MEPERTESTNAQTQLAVRVVESATPEERVLIAKWAQQLIKIRDSDLSLYDKAKEAVVVTASSDAIIPLVKNAGLELKRIGWDEQSWTARLGGTGVLAGLLLFTGQGAGIAALGGAIGVPLWVVLGAGGAFAGQLIESARASQQRHDPPPSQEGRVVEGEIVSRKRDNE